MTALFARNSGLGGHSDGNPLIYALKGINGYHIDESQKTILSNLIIRMVPLCFQPEDFDCIVSVPSSSTVSPSLSQCASRLLGIEMLGAEILGKISNAEAYEMLLGRRAAFANSRDKREFNDLYERLRLLPPGGSFKLKDVSVRLRSIFQPIKIMDPSIGYVSGKRVLIVDDVLATGQSLISAAAAITSLGAKGTAGMVLLGTLSKKA